MLSMCVFRVVFVGLRAFVRGQTAAGEAFTEALPPMPLEAGGGGEAAGETAGFAFVTPRGELPSSGGATNSAYRFCSLKGKPDQALKEKIKSR